MSQEQIHAFAFQGASRQAALNRLCSLVKSGYLERQYVTGANARVLAVFSNTPKALKVVENTYRHRITSPLCKSDSVPHDLILVSIRQRLEKLGLVTRYLTENMLQACEEFAQDQSIWPFVDNNTDAVMEVTRQAAKTLVGIEFENSEKAQERYARKLVKYYSDKKTPAIFYVCSSERIREAVSQAEGAVVGKNSPRCFYALLSDALRDSADCTFVDRNGAKIVLR